MKVQNDNLSAVASQLSRTVGIHESEDVGRSAPVESKAGDRIELSGLVSRIAQAQQQIETAQAARVRQLSAVYARREYVIDVPKLSHRIVDTLIGGMSPDPRAEP